MPRRGENIYKRKDGRWEGRYISSYKEDGHAKYSSVYGKTYAEVRQKLSDKKANQKNLKPSTKITVGELMDLWLEDRRNSVKASTHACYTALVERHIRPFLGSCALHELTSMKLEEYLSMMYHAGRADQNGGLSAKTICDILFVIKSAMKLAKKQCGFMDIDGVMDVKAPSVARRRVETFGINETKRMSELLLSNWDINHASIFLCLNTGIRLGELCGLRWSDLNIQENELRIARTVQRIREGDGSDLVVQSPKSISSERIIPIQWELIEMLLTLRRFAMDDAYILTGNSIPMDPRTVQYRFRNFLERNNFPVRNFHVLRHSFASRCIEQGMDVKCLSEILGHANIKTTMQLYVHPSMSKKR